MFRNFTVSPKNIGIQMIEVKMKKVILIIIGASLLTSCKVSKPTEGAKKGFFFKTKHKKDSEK